MVSENRFGGTWTEDKLERVHNYLRAYTTIFDKNLKASWFDTYYVDAFAGTGYRTEDIQDEDTTQSLFNEKEAVNSLQQDAQDLKEGSVAKALGVEPPFDHYVFIEKKREFAKQLETLKTRYPSKIIHVIEGEANSKLCEWIDTINWCKSRAVVFLDPYGMEVNWATIERIASTKGIDLWLLFPLAQGVTRLLPRGRIPDYDWSTKLTQFFGSEDWKNAFYKPSIQEGLFEAEITYARNAGFDAISEYFVSRLREVFAGVAENPLQLFNSKNLPLYLLCFASSNRKGAKHAVGIAQHILSR